MKIPFIIRIICAALIFSSLPINAQEFNKAQIDLPNCDVTITADQSYTNKCGVTYAGNVKVLVGFANLRINKVTLIKKKDGRCALIQDFDE